MTLNKSKTDAAMRQKYEWMTHNGGHEVISVGFCDWMEVTVEVWKKEKAVLLHYGLKQGASVLLAPSGWWWGICIHVVGPWENVSLGCIVSHCGSHLENHLPTSPPGSSSLSPPLALRVHSPPHTRTHTHQIFIHRLHSFCGWVIVQMHRPFSNNHKLALLSEHILIFWGNFFFLLWINGK